MSPWAVVFLAVIALASITQAAFVIVLALDSRRLAASLDELRARVEKDLKPALDSLSHITRNLAEISDLGVLQARRIDVTLSDTLDKIESTTEAIRRFVVKPLGPLAEIGAFFKGVRRGFEVYNHLRGFDKGSKGASRNYAEDEHLFI